MEWQPKQLPFSTNQYDLFIVNRCRRASGRIRYIWIWIRFQFPFFPTLDPRGHNARGNFYYYLLCSIGDKLTFEYIRSLNPTKYNVFPIAVCRQFNRFVSCSVCLTLTQTNLHTRAPAHQCIELRLLHTQRAQPQRFAGIDKLSIIWHKRTSERNSLSVLLSSIFHVNINFVAAKLNHTINKTNKTNKMTFWIVNGSPDDKKVFKNLFRLGERARARVVSFFAFQISVFSRGNNRN